MSGWGKSLGILVALAMIGSMGCGGGSASGEAASPGPSGTASLLSWEPPTTYEDNAPLDPYADLDHYEFYIREDANFTDSDLHMAEVNAVKDQALVSEFQLNNLLPFVPPGTRSYLSIRAVGVDGSKSPFSQPIAWDHT